MVGKCPGKGNRETDTIRIATEQLRTATESWARVTVRAPAGRADAHPCRGAGGGGVGALSRWWGRGEPLPTPLVGEAADRAVSEACGVAVA